MGPRSARKPAGGAGAAGAPGKPVRARPAAGPPLAALMLLLGAALSLYPAISSGLAERSSSQAVADHSAAVSALGEEERREEWEKAVRYNEALAGDPVRDPFLEGSGMALPGDYTEVLDTGGVMGYIDIPRISVHLPVYHGTSDEVLQKGAGHIRQTALPVGGAGTHAALTGHTGLPGAVLFTALDRLEAGDLFTVTVLGRKLAYRVDGAAVVEPDDVSRIDPEPGRDLVTLVTCTPYGINSHRLLVRGERTDYVPADEMRARAEGTAAAGAPVAAASVAGALAALAGAGAWGLVRRRRKVRAGAGTPGEGQAPGAGPVPGEGTGRAPGGGR